LDYKVETNEAVRSELKNIIDKENPFRVFVDWVRRQQDRGCNVVVVCGTVSRAERLDRILSPYGITTEKREGFPGKLVNNRQIRLVMGEFSGGFVWPEESLAVITDKEIFGPKRRRRKTSPRKIQTDLLAFTELKTGDLIVHIEQGIGQYEGLVKLKVERAVNDFLAILYQGGDKLYLPVDRMGMIQKYMGVEGVVPTLDKMGGKSWEKTKKKVKESVEKIAGELLKLYAERKMKEGYAYRFTMEELQDFESGFPFEETADQLKAIDEVMADMADPTPMDRLVCGDVGYGKTEVALRAAFVTVNEGKQVAVLVPTTVLAEQHYETFAARFAPYAVNVACLSRFRPPKSQRQILKDLGEGKIDIVIGTHRLIQKDVLFRDIGLLVVDEEQRFGVRHKEKLKQFRKTVDVLALSATPIPRTLHMSMMGIRDISVISTPPEHRHPIVTYICTFDDMIISQAIRKELERGGQIFFVHNNIRTIDAVARHLQELVPEVRLGVGHGRLNEEALEKSMFQFIKKEIDLLVCTTIIESGLDISAANTILINRADRFGLSQIYQLRGRVGRAEEQAYAYLFVPDESVLGKDAQKRLKVLMEHSDLGSGFQIAMSDLQIRGGGTILGASQSGHIAAVGYDMFLQLMENSMAEQKGEIVEESLDPEINIPMPTFIPETYIPDIDQRLLIYRRLSKSTELKELADFKSEWIDRFGPLPEEAANLLLKMMLKLLSVKAGVARLDLSDNGIFLYFSAKHRKDANSIVQLVASDPEHFEFTADLLLKYRPEKFRLGRSLGLCKKLLKDIIQNDSDIRF